VEQNHGKLLYPEWSNASDYVRTPESFGTVELHSEELGAKIKAKAKGLDFNAKVAKGKKLKIHLTPDQRYLCKATRLPLPLLPVHGEVECKLFSHLVLNQQQQVCRVYYHRNTILVLLSKS